MTGSEWFAALPGGLNRYFTDLFTALRKHPGVDVTAAAFGEPPTGGRSWGPTGGSTLSRVAASVTDRSDLRKPAILDRHFCLYGPPQVGAGHGRLVVHFHGPWAAESTAAGAGALNARAKYLVERLRYTGAQRFVVLSEHFRNVLIEDYRVPADRISVIPPGVDLDRFTVSAHDGSAHGVRRTVLCVRRLEHRMGIHRLIESWHAVAAAHPDARLVIVGTGSAERELRAQVSAAGLDHTIEFTGRVDDDELTRLYSLAEFTVVPSVALEGFGLIALESLASGRPAVVTECGGLPDAVRGLDPSLIVQPDNADALGARLISALDGALPEPARCRAHAESFSWTTAAERHQALYAELSA